MTQQTAVEWLFNKIKLKADSIPTNTAYNRRAKGVYVDCLMLIKEAKQMDKEQAFELFKAGQDSMEEGGKNFEIYYNETFGKIINQEHKNETDEPDPRSLAC